MYSLVFSTARRKSRGPGAWLELRGRDFARVGSCLGMDALSLRSRRSRRLSGVVVAGSVGRAARAHGDDDVDGFFDVVEGEDLVEEHEVGVGDVELVGGGFGERFDAAHDVVREEADGAGGEGRKAGEAGGGFALRARI